MNKSIVYSSVLKNNTYKINDKSFSILFVSNDLDTLSLLKHPQPCLNSDKKISIKLFSLKFCLFQSYKTKFEVIHVRRKHFIVFLKCLLEVHFILIFILFSLEIVVFFDFFHSCILAFFFYYRLSFANKSVFNEII